MILFGLIVAAAMAGLWAQRWLERLNRDLSAACRFSTRETP